MPICMYTVYMNYEKYMCISVLFLLTGSDPDFRPGKILRHGIDLTSQRKSNEKHSKTDSK